MREIKFRAWGRRQGFFMGGMILDIEECRGQHECDYCFGSYLNNPSYEVMQYTGLKDKNGQEAYYDDIEDLMNCYWQIIWDSTYAVTMLKRISGEHSMKEIPGWNITKGEVIGNIYENLELLKEEPK